MRQVARYAATLEVQSAQLTLNYVLLTSFLRMVCALDVLLDA